MVLLRCRYDAGKMAPYGSHEAVTIVPKPRVLKGARSWSRAAFLRGFSCWHHTGRADTNISQSEESEATWVVP